MADGYFHRLPPWHHYVALDGNCFGCSKTVLQALRPCLHCSQQQSNALAWLGKAGSMTNATCDDISGCSLAPADGVRYSS